MNAAGLRARSVVARARRRRADVHLVLMLVLTFSTGVVDAIGYLGLDKVFAGNMTGNVVILGMALVGAEGLPWVGPLIALVAFMIGAAIGGRVLRSVASGWTVRTTVLFAVAGAVLAALTVALGVGGVPSGGWELVPTGFLAAAMGLQAATARHLAVKDVTTVVVTSTITGFAADSRLAGGGGQPWLRRLAAIVLIAVGALVGALALTVHIALGLGIAAGLTLAAAAVGHLLGSDPTDP